MSQKERLFGICSRCGRGCLVLTNLSTPRAAEHSCKGRAVLGTWSVPGDFLSRFEIPIIGPYETAGSRHRRRQQAQQELPTDDQELQELYEKTERQLTRMIARLERIRAEIERRRA